MTHSELANRLKHGAAYKMKCDLRFNTNSNLLRPRPGLTVVLRALVWAAQPENADKRLLVAGHTDAVGSEEDNLSLSTRRALNVLWLLVGDKQKWVANAVESYGNVKGTKSAKRDALAVRDMVGKPDAAFPPIDDPKWESAETWGKVFDIYENRLEYWCYKPPLVTGIYEYTDAEARLPKLEKLRGLLKNRLLLPLSGDGQEVVLGCGEAFLEQKVQTATHINRRIELLWFEDDPHDGENTLFVPWENDQEKVEKPGIANHKEAIEVGGVVYGDGAGWEWEALGCPEPLIRASNKSALVIDISGSMATEDVQVGSKKRTRLAAAKEMLSSVIDGCQDNEQFAAVAFGTGLLSLGVIPSTRTRDGRKEVIDNVDSEGKTINGSPNLRSQEDIATNGGRLKLVKGTPENQRMARTWVKDLPYYGGTNLWAGLNRAMSVDGIKEVVLLSDGAPGLGICNEAAIVRLASERSGGGTKLKVRVYGFAPGFDVGPDDDDVEDTPVQAEVRGYCEKLYAYQATQADGFRGRGGWMKANVPSAKHRAFQNAWLPFFLRKLAGACGGKFYNLSEVLTNLRQGVTVH